MCRRLGALLAPSFSLSLAGRISRNDIRPTSTPSALHARTQNILVLIVRASAPRLAFFVACRNLFSFSEPLLTPSHHTVINLTSVYHSTCSTALFFVSRNCTDISTSQQRGNGLVSTLSGEEIDLRGRAYRI